jgi:hypothetical protein
MAKKKAAEEIPPIKSIEERLNKTNPLYMAICENSKTCTQPSKHTDLGDMMLETCSHCMARRSWITKAELAKIEKAKAKEDEKALKQTEKETAKAEKKAEKPVVAKVISEPTPEVLDIEIEGEVTPVVSEKVDPQEDLQIKKNAEEMKNAFASIDKLVSTSGLNKSEITEVVKGLDDDYNPFEDGNAQEKAEENFVIKDFKPVSDEEVDLICDTLNGKNRFKVRVTTSPEKIKMIVNNPTKIIDKKAKVEFKGYDDKGRPIDPVYLGFAK